MPKIRKTAEALLVASLVLVCASPARAIPPSYETALPNGLRVIMIPDNRVEMAVSYVVINAGVRNEAPDINGATHLLEHMLFNGTESRTQEELYAEADELGAFNNAFTRKDFTAFMILAPSRTFEQAFALQADMILHSTLPPEKFEKERGIVLEEINQDTSHAYGVVEAAWNRLLWAGTPYEMPILGPKSVIATIPRDKVWDYYKTYYAPNNITLLIIGDFAPENMLELVKREYGDAAPTQIPESKASPQAISASKIEKRYFPDAEPRLYFAVPLQSRGLPLFGLTSYTNVTTNPHYQGTYQATMRSRRNITAVTASKSGTTKAITVAKPEPQPPSNVRVRRTPDPYIVRTVALPLVEKTLKKALEEVAGDEVKLDLSEDSHPKGGFLVGTIDVADEAAGEKLADALPSALAKLREVKVHDDWLARRKRELSADEIKSYDNFLYYGMFKSYDIAAGRWSVVRDWKQEIDEVGARDVLGFLNRLSFRNQVLSMLALPYPKGEAKAARETKTMKRTLANGVTALVRSDDRSEVFGATVLFKNRNFLEPAGKNGIAELLMRVYSQGPKGMTEDEFSDKLAELGLTLDFCDNPYIPMDDIYLSPRYSFIKAEGLDANWKESLMLLAQIVREPRLTEDALAKAKQSLAHVLGMKAMQPRNVARQLFYSGLFPDSGLAKNVEGDMREMQSVTLDELSEFADVYAAGENMIFSVATSADADALMEEIAALFGAIPAGEPASPPRVSAGKTEGATKALGREQAYIYFGYAFDGFTENDRAALSVLGAIISGKAAFVIREQRGLAYSIGAGFSDYKGIGWFSLAMGTDPDNVETAKELIRKVLKEQENAPITQAGIEQVVNSQLGRWGMRLITRKNQAFYAAYDELVGTKRADLLAAIKEITPAEVEHVREKYFTPEKGVFFVVE